MFAYKQANLVTNPANTIEKQINSIQFRNDSKEEEKKTSKKIDIAMMHLKKRTCQWMHESKCMNRFCKSYTKYK